MTDYRIDNTNGMFWVINSVTDEPVRSGPYKTEESAKRRIRDLKRKEVENINRADGDIGANSIGTLIASDPQSNEPEPTETLYSLTKYDIVDAPEPETYPANWDKEPVVRQIGCYPAISKHAYRR
jgi:hypothetical protein